MGVVGEVFVAALLMKKRFFTHFHSNCFHSERLLEQLGNCMQDHHTTCDAILGRKRDIPILLLDVEQMKLQDATTSAKYLCLSYVWGTLPSFSLTKEWVERAKVPNSIRSLEQSLPKAMTDAIAITRLMKHRYLWIDALCIVQDDAEHKHGQIMNMDIIYGYAVLTLVFASASSANDRNLLHLQMDGEANDRCQLRRLAFQSLQRRVTDRLGAKVVSVKPSRSDRTAKQTFVYPTRAWTFQEEMLSKRLLYVSSLGNFYVCRQHRIPKVLEEVGIGTAVDAMWNTRLYPRRQVGGIRGPGPHPLRHGTFRPLPPGSFVVEQEKISQKAQNSLLRYVSLVEDYTRRTLTFKSDKLLAFAGVMEAMKNGDNSHEPIEHFLYGLPLTYLAFALYWVRKSGINRRPVDDPKVSTLGPVPQPSQIPS
jgi:hypothetical protein